MRLLVIEDDPGLARQITRELQRSGHDSSARDDGAEGLAPLVQTLRSLDEER